MIFKVFNNFKSNIRHYNHHLSFKDCIKNKVVGKERSVMKKTYKKIVQWLEGVRTVELTAINIMIITIAIVITVLNIAIKTFK